MYPVCLFIPFRLFFCFIHYILFSCLLLNPEDPEKGRTGSFRCGGGFPRKALHIVAYSDGMATRCRVLAAEEF